jgi:lipopolysaccharide/colanic/teichoic acid biosynthesis glycosyltransferase
VEAHQFAESLPQPRASRAAALVRRAADLTLAGLGLLLLAPVLLVLVLAIRLDSRGSAFFRQRRLGRDGEPFTVNKLRTMHSDCDQDRHRDYVLPLIRGERERVPDGPENGLYKLSGDERVTRVGRLLRRWSLDELPQLWNVVRGEMSLVGPRPVIPYEADAYPGWYRERFAVKPGMTGLWQVSGRNERTYDEMVRLDIDYVRRRSLWLDVTILARTAWVVLARRGAA